MKLPTLLPTLVLLSLMSFSCSTDVIEEDKIEAIQNSHIPQTKTIEVEVLELINSHRINIGLQPLNGMSTIKAEAYGHTDYMIENDEVSHANFFQRKNNLMNNALTAIELPLLNVSFVCENHTIPTKRLETAIKYLY